MGKIIILTKDNLDCIAKEIVKNILSGMRDPKQNALLRKLIGDNEYDSLNVSDDFKKLFDLLAG